MNVQFLLEANASEKCLIPSMVCILAALLLLRRPIEAKESEAVR